ncbi:MAG: hypothetical protein NVSMB42_01070 [Herpetosiphon sp.]
MLRHFFRREEGQGLVEYALILLLIVIVVVGVLTLLRQRRASVTVVPFLVLLAS